MKKICFVTTVSITLKSFVVDLAKYLYNTNEFEIWFVCDYDEEFKNSLPEYIHYHPISMKRGISFDGLRVIKQLKELFKKEKFDLVQYSTPNASLYTSIAAKQAKVPVRLYCQWGILYVGFNGIKRKIFKFIEKLVCKNSTYIEPDSFGNLEFSRNEGLYKDNKSSVVWNGSASGVNLEKFNYSNKSLWRKEVRKKYNISNDIKVFIFVGRITRDKGINELISATKMLINDGANFRLLIVGNIEGIGTLQKDLYKWSTTEKKIIYCGYTNEVEKYLAASDIYVLPSYREGFGTAVIEAEAMGLPVIVTNIPGPIDAMIKNKTGLVIEKNNIEDLYIAMKDLLTNDSKLKEFEENALLFSRKNFDQKIFFNKVFFDRKKLINSKIK